MIFIHEVSKEETTCNICFKVCSKLPLCGVTCDNPTFKFLYCIENGSNTETLNSAAGDLLHRDSDDSDSSDELTEVCYYYAYSLITDFYLLISYIT